MTDPQSTSMTGTREKIAEMISHQLLADFSDDACGCDQCEGERNGCREIADKIMGLCAALRAAPEAEPVARNLDIRSFSISSRDSRCLEVWFAQNVTDADRAALLSAINAAGHRTHPLPPDGVREALRLLHKIADLVDAEDAGEPLDDAIKYANHAIDILSGIVRPSGDET